MSLRVALRALVYMLCVTLAPAPARAEATTLDAPASVPSGSKVAVTWTGPAEDYDTIGLLPIGAPDSEAPGDFRAVTFGNNPTHVLTPEAPGVYELRFFRSSGAMVARRKLIVTPVTASLKAPASIAGGNTVAVTVTGPRNENDALGIFPVGAPDDAQTDYSARVFENDPVNVVAPEQPGEYEIRYLRGQSGTPLARAKLTVGGTSASIKGPGKAQAGSDFKVQWQGPGSEYDHIVVAPKGAPEDKWVTHNYVFHSSPATLPAPVDVGQYELRYQTSQSGTTLARDDLEVVPAREEPGLLRVSAAQSTLSTGGAVEIILDASGSMLQRIGSERRIDIAKQTLARLTSSVIPAGTPFALRVFGREANSCQSDLDLPLRPLDAPAVASKLAALEAKSGAKTPIAASIEKVAADLSQVKGERLVILVTDGEETCGGNPRRAIAKLRQNGVNVRVNIVGFAVDDAKIAATFRQWSIAGNGAYFDARDAQSLNGALASAVHPAYQVLDAKKKVVAEGLAGGEPVRLLPGTYTVSLKGQKGRSKRTDVRANETASVSF